MKKIVAFIIAILLLSTVASAEVYTDVSSTLGSLVVTASIDMGTENAYRIVSINVYDIARKKYVYVDAGVADEYGRYTFEFVNTGKSGDYKVYYSCPDIEYSGNKTLSKFKGMADYQSYVDDINNNMSNTSGMKTALENYLSFVKWDTAKYDQISNKDIFYKLFTAEEKTYIDLLDIKDDFEFVTRLAYDIDKEDTDDFYKLYSEDKEKEIFGFRNVIPAGKVDTILDDVRASIKKVILRETLKGGKYSKSDITDMLAFNILKCSIKNAEHYEDVKLALQGYKAKYLKTIDLNSKYAVNAYKKMMGNEYTSYKQVEDAYNNIIKAEMENDKKKKDSSAPSGGGGGGGGLRPVIKDESVQNPATETDADASNDTENSLVAAPNVPKMYFNDMEDAKWALDAVNALYERKVISGMGDGSFAPHKTVTRAEFAQMAVRLTGYQASSDTTFVDVPYDAWYFNAVRAARDNGIIVGHSDGTFKPDDEITREQIALVIFKMISDKVNFEEASATKFDDDAQIDEVYNNAVYALKSLGIIKGRSEKTFCPDEKVTRVEAAVLLNNICNYFN